MKRNNLEHNRKIIAIIFFFFTFLILAVFVWRFTRIMATESVDGENLRQMVEMQYSGQSHLPAKRGALYDRQGEAIATTATSYKLIGILTDEWSQADGEPQHIVDKEETAKVLSRHIDMEEEEILDRLNQEDVKQVEFGQAGANLTYDMKRKIEEEGLPGLTFEETPTRLYPNGVFASHVVGLAQADKESETKDLVGVLGLEASLQDILAGEDGYAEYKKDQFGYAIPGEQAEIVDAVDGNDVHLTIDKSLQIYLESVMSEVNETNPAVAVTATMMDAESGKILAASQRPTFDATTKENIDATWQTFHSEYTYEPGSTLKVLTLAAAINEGVYQPQAMFDSGQYDFYGTTINDWNPEGWGSITYLDGISHSSNVGFVHMFEDLGTETWKSYLDAFRFSQKTGVPLPNENSGSNPYATIIQQANTSFGQGLTVTPVQMMQAFSAIANDGQMMQPRLIEKVVNPETGEETQYESQVVSQPITAETAQATLDNLLLASQHPESTTQPFQIDGYDVALKTGTSQIVDPDTGRYMIGGNNYIYSVVGFAPAQNPKYVFYVTVQQPEFTAEASYGSQVVANIFSPVLKWTLDQSGLGPTISNSNPNASSDSTEEQNE